MGKASKACSTALEKKKEREGKSDNGRGDRLKQSTWGWVMWKDRLLVKKGKGEHTSKI